MRLLLFGNDEILCFFIIDSARLAVGFLARKGWFWTMRAISLIQCPPSQPSLSLSQKAQCNRSAMAEPPNEREWASTDCRGT
jgi:hypothetical protein